MVPSPNRNIYVDGGLVTIFKAFNLHDLIPFLGQHCEMGRVGIICFTDEKPNAQRHWNGLLKAMQ